MAPPRSLMTASSGSWTVRPRWTFGWTSWNAASAPGTSEEPAVGKAARRSRPIWPERRAANASSASLDRGQDPRGVLAQQQGGVCRPDTAARPLEQQAPGLALERRHMLADGRRAEVEGGGGPGHRAGVDDGLEHLEAADVEHTNS